MPEPVVSSSPPVVVGRSSRSRHRHGLDGLGEKNAYVGLKDHEGVGKSTWGVGLKEHAVPLDQHPLDNVDALLREFAALLEEESSEWSSPPHFFPPKAITAPQQEQWSPSAGRSPPGARTSQEQLPGGAGRGSSSSGGGSILGLGDDVDDLLPSPRGRGLGQEAISSESAGDSDILALLGELMLLSPMIGDSPPVDEESPPRKTSEQEDEKGGEPWSASPLHRGAAGINGVISTRFGGSGAVSSGGGASPAVLDADDQRSATRAPSCPREAPALRMSTTGSFLLRPVRKKDPVVDIRKAGASGILVGQHGVTGGAGAKRFLELADADLDALLEELEITL